MWDPRQIADTTEDPFKTLFISRIVRSNQFANICTFETIYLNFIVFFSEL
jgi:hypothetical protein